MPPGITRGKGNPMQDMNGKNEWTYYAGRTAEGHHVWVDVRADVETGKTLTLTDHTTTDAPMRRVSASWTVADGKSIARPQAFATGGVGSMSSPRFDRAVMSMGQTPPEDRVVTDPALDPDTLAFIERTWADWHLNDVQAACDHMREGIDWQVPDDADLPESRYGRGDALQKWKLDNVTCAAGTGYRWGHAWLAKRVPDDVWTRWLALASGEGK